MSIDFYFLSVYRNEMEQLNKQISENAGKLAASTKSSKYVYVRMLTVAYIFIIITYLVKLEVRSTKLCFIFQTIWYNSSPNCYLLTC